MGKVLVSGERKREVLIIVLQAIFLLQLKCRLADLRLFCFGLLMILDGVCCYLLLFLLYINIEIGKNRC